MKTWDPRLLRHVSSLRAPLGAAVALGCAGSLLLICQAWVLARAIVAVFLDGTDLAGIWPDVRLLVVVVVARAAVTHIGQWAASRASAKAMSQLRVAALERVIRRGPQAAQRHRTAELAQLATRGIDGLDAYFARYLPQLVLAAIVPIAVAVAIVTLDLMSAIIVVVTVPLIPVFMILIGRHTAKLKNRQWRTLAVLSGYFLDVVAGLPTLKAFGRVRAHAAILRGVGDRYRHATMKVLRIAFLSSFVLELVATLGVAVVAVSIGLRLVGGSMDLFTGLFVLILVPEVYLPLRLLASNFHTAADGMTAATKLMDLLDEPVVIGDPMGGPPDLLASDLMLSGISVTHPGRSVPAIADLACRIPAGQVTALVGPSGAGKSTLLSVLLGFVVPDSGAVTLAVPRTGHAAAGGVAPERRSARWLDQIAWLPAEPAFLPGTVADNVRLGSRGASDGAVTDAAVACGLAPCRDQAAAMLRRPVGERGAGLSAGQLRRVALARVVLRDAPLVLLDEPTAALDPETERCVVRVVEQLRAEGRTVVVVAHRRAIIDTADSVIHMSPASAPAPVPSGESALDVAGRS